MAGRSQRKCKGCQRLFRPDARNRRHQRYCSEEPCRAASKAASQARWLSQPENQDYFRGELEKRVRLNGLICRERFPFDREICAGALQQRCDRLAWIKSIPEAGRAPYEQDLARLTGEITELERRCRWFGITAKEDAA